MYINCYVEFSSRTILNDKVTLQDNIHGFTNNIYILLNWN